MSRLDRLLGILFRLRQDRAVPATELAKVFGVSPRTIYRDVDALSVLGVPVYAERGREGGFRLLEGYHLPPIMFSRQEAVSLVAALTLLASLRARPFAHDLETAEAKLLAAVPESLRAVLAEAQKVIGFEQTPPDTFHWDPLASPPAVAVDSPREGEYVTAFLNALLQRRAVWVRYRSPFRTEERAYTVTPLGLFWDRGHWYLVGLHDVQETANPRLWRADRILELALDQHVEAPVTDFDVRDLLGRSWLESAMETWRRESPVKIRLTRAQADLLRKDWYYCHARYVEVTPDEVVMSYGDDDQGGVLALIRWLGVGAELLEPRAWRPQIKGELARMMALYEDRDETTR